MDFFLSFFRYHFKWTNIIGWQFLIGKLEKRGKQSNPRKQLFVYNSLAPPQNILALIANILKTKPAVFETEGSFFSNIIFHMVQFFSICVDLAISSSELYSKLSFRIQVQIKRSGLKPKDIEPDPKDKEYNPEDDVSSRKGEKRKPFEALGPRMKKIRMAPVVDHIKKWSKENGPSVSQTAAMAAKMNANAEGNLEEAKMFRQIEEGQNPYADHEMSTEAAVALQVGYNCYILRFYVKSGLD